MRVCARHLLVWISELSIILFYSLFSFMQFKMEKLKLILEIFLDNGETLQAGMRESCLDLAKKHFSAAALCLQGSFEVLL